MFLAGEAEACDRFPVAAQQLMLWFTVQKAGGSSLRAEYHRVLSSIIDQTIGPLREAVNPLCLTGSISLLTQLLNKLGYLKKRMYQISASFSFSQK